MSAPMTDKRLADIKEWSARRSPVEATAVLEELLAEVDRLRSEVERLGEDAALLEFCQQNVVAVTTRDADGEEREFGNDDARAAGETFREWLDLVRHEIGVPRHA